MARARPKTPAASPAPAARSNGRRKRKPAAPPAPPTEPPVVHTLIPQPHGGALRVGNPGNSGRPPSAFKEMMARLSVLPEAERILEGILEGKLAIETKGGIMLVDGRLFLDTHKHVSEHGQGKPATIVQGGREPLRIMFVRE